MRIYPAIDLRGGSCVRLTQGDYRRETVYDPDPGSVAERFARAGVAMIHVVDLDAARTGTRTNQEAIAAIVKAAAPVPCQLGGGMRDDASVEAALETGISRVVIGTAAVREPDWFRSLAARLPGTIALGLDAREGRIATDGWVQGSHLSAFDFAREFDDLPLAAIIFTDITRDGMMAGPDLEATRQLASSVKTPVIASGGVGSLDDLRQLACLPLDGVIVGRALYEGRFTLDEALAALDPARARDGLLRASPDRGILT
jgi:phosphoribosylformimino-5-aminoimidazole carboxamide ribotide isomerase